MKYVVFDSISRDVLSFVDSNAPPVEGDYIEVDDDYPDTSAIRMTIALDGIEVRPAHVETIDEAKSRISTLIGYKHTQILYGGFTYDGHVFDSDERSMNLISGEASAAFETGAVESSYWKTQANTWYPITPLKIAEIRDAMRAHISATFQVMSSKKTQLMALDDLQLINDFDIETGW